MSIFSLILKYKGYPITEATRDLKSIQSMRTDDFISWQNKQAWDIVRFHFENNSFYRNKVGRRLPDRWDDLPVISKSDLQQPVQEILTKGYDVSNSYIGNTSGSSGTPFYYVKDKYAHAMTWALINSRYSIYDLNFSDRQARFYGIPKEFLKYWKEKVKDAIMNRERFSVFDLSDEMLEKYFSKFRNGRFDYLYGYTNSLVLFARYLIKRNIVLKEVCPSLKVCISTSELCTPEDDVLLKNAFGIPHVREYGVSETCLTGFDMPGIGWALTEETLYNEVVDDSYRPIANGIEGNILSTSLFNKAFPMIRYQVGDLGAFEDRGPGIYRTIGRLVGRTNDNVVLPSGRVAAGLTFYYISRSILESSGVLKEFIIRQTKIDHFDFDVVSDKPLTQSEVIKIKEKISVYLEPGLSITINNVEKINRPASGKIKHFYSELGKH